MQRAGEAYFQRWARKFNLLVRIAYLQILGLIPQLQIRKFVRINLQIANPQNSLVFQSTNSQICKKKLWICGFAEVFSLPSQICKLSHLRKVCKSKKNCGFAERPPLHICKLIHSLRLISINLNCPKGEKTCRQTYRCLYEKNTAEIRVKVIVS